MDQMQNQQAPMQEAPPQDVNSKLDKPFLQLALDPEFGQAIQLAMDNMPSPVHAAAVLLYMAVENVEAKLGTLNDDEIYSQRGAGTKFVMTILKMADEAGYEGAASMENAETAVQFAAALSAASAVIAESGGEMSMQEQPMPEQMPQGLMGGMA